ncbi:DUF86 domain-containing protein [Aeromicrobium erythreum]|uniref:HepT-like ribonuclease domain-containing protein n=1 Tax=Aeromicrobium erythreum TaxID=2041 RepID=UPI000831C054|nr:HepT-like ribonuclease domain-containing protein [Aeromicrobium erythreum]
MDRRVAKELLHLRDWFVGVDAVTGAGRAAYLVDPLRQEAGDSLLMKIGETANRLRRADLAAPEGVRWADAVATRNWLIHQYDTIDRSLTWTTLVRDVPAWRDALAELVAVPEDAASP